MTYFLALAAMLFAGGWRPAGRVVAALCAVVLLGLLASRMVLSWHWPSDMVGGALLGLALAAATCAVTARTLPGLGWVERRVQAMLAVLGRATRLAGAVGGADTAGGAVRPVRAPSEGHTGPPGSR